MHFVHAQSAASRGQKLTQFLRLLDALGREIEAEDGESDLAHLERIKTLSRRLSLAGRGLLHFSVEPVAFSAGVFALWVHKCLEQMEIRHASLAGPAGTSAHADTRSAISTPWGHTARAMDWLALTNSLDLHLTDSIALFAGYARGTVQDADAPALVGLHHRLHLRALGYLAKTVVSLPLLARPFFWKVALGNVVSEAARDLFASAMTHGGRTRVGAVSAGATREQRCLSQIESARDIEVPRVVSILCGALDKRVEHHLFPHLPPNRLRQLAPRVRALCAEYGIVHRSASLMETLWLVIRELHFRSQGTGSTTRST